MKRGLKWLGRLCAALLLLPLIGWAALYVPYVQQWIGGEVMSRLSALTGYTCSSEWVRIYFPLQVHVNALCVAHENDTLISVGQIEVSAALRPLWRREAVVDYLTCREVVLHTDSLLHGVHLDGKVGYLHLDEARFVWSGRSLQLGDISVADVRVDVAHSMKKERNRDTVRSFPMLFSVDGIRVKRTRVAYRTAAQEVLADIPSLSLHSLDIDTLSSFSLLQAQLHEGILHYGALGNGDDGTLLTGVGVCMDSLYFAADSASGVLTALAFDEGHGITMQDARLAFQVVEGMVRLPYFALRTDCSSMDGHLYSLERKSDTWQIEADVNGSIGYRDMVSMGERFSDISEAFLAHYPEAPLLIEVAVHGPLSALTLTRCSVSLATAFDMQATGQMQGLPDYQDLTAQVEMDATLHDLDFLTGLLDTLWQRRIQIPHEVVAEASLSYGDDSIHTHCTARFDGGSLGIEGSYGFRSACYAMTLTVDTLDMHRILPSEPLGQTTVMIALEGKGNDWNASDSQFDCSVWIDSMDIDGRTYSSAHIQASLNADGMVIEGDYADTLVRLAMKGAVRYAEERVQAHLYVHVYEADLKGIGITEVDIHPSFQSHWILTVDSLREYVLRAHLYDMTLTSVQRVVTPQPIRLRTYLNPDSMSVSVSAGDLKLRAYAHTVGLPWHWDGVADRGEEVMRFPLSDMQLTLQAGTNNPMSNYLTLLGMSIHSLDAHLYTDEERMSATASVGHLSVKGIAVDTVTLVAQSLDGLLKAHVQTSEFVWQKPMMQLAGSVSAEVYWDNDFSSDNLRGSLRLAGIRLSMPAYSLLLTSADTLTLPFAQGKLWVNDVALYGEGRQPLLLNGTITLLGEDPSLQLQLDAQRVDLLQRYRTRESLLYGKALFSGRVDLSGSFTALNLQGSVVLLGGSELYYVYKDASLAANNSLDDVVTFVDFSSLSVSPPPSKPLHSVAGFTMNLDLAIDSTVQLDVQLGASGENSLTLQGGGNLNLQHIPAVGVKLAGKYTVSSGTLQMNVPLLHVHSMTIRPGSMVQWSGNALNPILAVTIEDRIRTSVTIDDMPQTVLFVTGVSLSDTMERLGVQFTLSAPENASMQNALAALSPDERSKLAVALLTTGLYLGEGGTGNLMNTALIGFLQAQLDNISRDTFRSVDVSFGIEPLQDGMSGVSTRTDYSFSIAKRFWHDRIRVIIGGSVTTSNERIEDNAIIDNVSVEWRIKPDGNQILRLFYDKSYESILEGEIRKMGAGYAYRRKF